MCKGSWGPSKLRSEDRDTQNLRKRQLAWAACLLAEPMVINRGEQKRMLPHIFNLLLPELFPLWSETFARFESVRNASLKILLVFQLASTKFRVLRPWNFAGAGLRWNSALQAINKEDEQS